MKYVLTEGNASVAQSPGLYVAAKKELHLSWKLLLSCTPDHLYVSITRTNQRIPKWTT